jgi:serine/threonine protein phosphatase PrpC
MSNSSLAKNAVTAALETLLNDPRIGELLPAPTDPQKVDLFLKSQRGIETSSRVLEMVLEMAETGCLVDDESITGDNETAFVTQSEPSLEAAPESASFAEIDSSPETPEDITAVSEQLSEPPPDTVDPLLNDLDSCADPVAPIDEDNSLRNAGEGSDTGAPASVDRHGQNDLADTDEVECQPPTGAGAEEPEGSGAPADNRSGSATNPAAEEEGTVKEEMDPGQSISNTPVRPTEHDSSAEAGFGASKNPKQENFAEYARTPATAPAPRRYPVDPPKLHVELPNSKEGVPYSETPVVKNHGKPIAVKIAEVRFPVDLGLRFDPASGRVEGTPTKPGDHKSTLIIQYPDGDSLKHREVKFVFVVNFDPESLWKEIDPSPDAPFWKPHTASQRRLERGVELIAASRRGRAHANKGTFRDDDFKITVGPDYYLVSVADGAGSAAYSREGSRITVDKFSDSICAAFADKGTRQSLTRAIQPWLDDLWQQQEANESYRSALFELAKVIHGAGKAAIDEVAAAAKENNSDPRSFATTLLSVLLLELQPRGYIVCSFSVGDGAIGMHLDGKSYPLMRPDSGEQAGETRFLTNSILTDTQTFYQRIYVRYFEELGPIFLMTDGVSDPLFSSESKILGERGWDDFYKAIAPVLRDSGNKAEDQLVEWLNFYAPSHNDDRTIAMIFPGSDRSEILAYGEGLPDV